ncbi:ABC1 kinase family protein [Demequina activiva]|uniref:ABC transporter n=1 Tax=Demequina activiva TaxID=1582364 RepID=A0A919UG76_9MICO|nr:AarF/UbiB family protein [Demequina activiva]GIG54552.1 ABC transporter [Demequina activiva]
MPDEIHDRARYRRILRFAARHLAVTWWYEILLPRIGLRRVAERTRTARMRTFARRFRGLAVDLGGLMIKLGQFMSSRLDVLPPEITKELEDLQDEVPAVPFDAIRELAEHELGLPLERVFSTIDTEPVAAASLGQVYRAVLTDSESHDTGFAGVVMKVQRPGIGDIVAIDLAALRRVGRWLSRVRLVSSRVDIRALIEEFADVSREEIDYLHEAGNAERFAANFADDPRVKVPQVAWERTTSRVLTLEDVTAIKITDRERLRGAGIKPAEVAPVFAELMFDQLFEHGFFHGDPHPGNLFVEPAAPGAEGPPWRLTFVDFGMMGSVPDTLRGSLRALVIASAQRDGAGMVKAMSNAGVLLPSADTVELERVVSEVFSRFGGMGFAELREVDEREFRDFAMEFSDVLLTLPFQLPEDFLLVVRAVSLTSGVCSSLDPAYNVWDTVEPYAQRLLRSETGDFVGDFAREATQIAGVAWRLPKRFDSVLSRLEDGNLPVAAPRLEATVTRLERTARRLVSALLFAALLLAGALVHADSEGLGVTLMVASGVPLLVTVFGGRSKR